MIRTALGWVTGGSTTRLAATLLVGIAMGGTLAHQVHRAINDRAEVQRQRETLRAIEAAQAETIRLQEVADEANRRAAERTQVHQRAAAGARAELDRLRNAIATPGGAGAPACAAGADGADPARELLGACAAQLVELGRAADAHAADALRLYEAWPTHEAQAATP